MCCEVFKFWVKDLMDYGTRNGKSLSLGMPKAPQDKIQGHQKALFCLRSSVTLLGAIFLFTTWYVFCLERLVWFESLLVSLTQASLLYTPFERAIHDLEFVRILYVLRLYLLSYIVFALVLHFYLLEHGSGFVLYKLLFSHDSLRLFWES